MGGGGLHEQLVTAFGLDEVLEAAVRGGLDVPGEAGGRIRLPSLEFHQGEFKSQYGLADTDSLVDQTMQDFLSLLEATAKLAELESSVWLLARELKKTQRHVNALEHIFIPDYKETLKYVEQALESKELESFFTMKRVKKNLGGEDGENPPDDSDNGSIEPSNL